MLFSSVEIETATFVLVVDTLLTKIFSVVGFVIRSGSVSLVSTLRLLTLSSGTESVSATAVGAALTLETTTVNL